MTQNTAKASARSQDNRPQTVLQLNSNLLRILAPNPSMMTYWGTNTYVLGSGNARVVIDPGPDIASHHEQIIATLPMGAVISHILVTHAHLDHSSGAATLAAKTGAKTYSFGPATSGRSEIMAQLVRSGLSGGGEGVDDVFEPNVVLQDGQVLHTNAGDITAIHTPGHMANHLCFEWQDQLFTGDLIMGWSSSLISPPDGDAAAFRNSCERLLKRPDMPLHPGHGASVDEGHKRIADLYAHRATREEQILSCLEKSEMNERGLKLAELTKLVYSELPEAALPAAARNTFAHLIDLVDRNHITVEPNLSEIAVFRIRSE